MLEQRADCDYYAPQHYQLLDKLQSSPFQLRRLRDITTHIVDGPFGSAIKAEDYVDAGIPFIRVADVTRGEGTIRTDDLAFISHEAHRKISRSRAIPGDVIIAKTGATMGAASVLPKDIEEANIRGDLALVGSLDSSLHAHYLSAYINTSIGYRLFWRLNSGSTRGRVVISNLRKLPVLWPDEEGQETVVGLIKAGRQAKQQKEAEASRLLASIDDYFLDELGISLPPEPENAISNRIFTSRRQELMGWRFDPAYFEARFTRLLNSVKKSGGKLTTLRSVCSFLSNGRTPAREGYSEAPTDYPIIKVASYTGDLIDLGKVEYATDVQPMSVKCGDIFVLSAAHQPDFVGRFVKLLDEEPLHSTSFVGELICVRANQAVIETDYLFAILSSPTFQSLVNREKRGQTSHIYPNDIGHLLIPLPKHEVQVRIAEKIRTIREEAKRLRQQAESELETAKRQIEGMLLGEVAP